MYIYILVTDPLNLWQVSRMLWLTRLIAMLRCVCVWWVAGGGRGHALYTHTHLTCQLFLSHSMRTYVGAAS
jgi:hypothetical protein